MANSTEIDTLDFFCICGDLTHAADGIVVTHHFPQGLVVEVSLLRCQNCAKKSLCPANIFGLHSRVFTPDDDEYVPGKVDWSPPEQTNSRYLSQDRSAPPNNHQYGYCSSCYQPMHWNTETFGWEDCPEPITHGPHETEEI